MSTENQKSRAWRAALCFLAMVTATQAADQEKAIAWTADDSRLQWGACPAFLPEGCRIAVLHGDPAKANADVFFKVPANSNLPLHWHTSAERMVLVAGELRVTYEGQAATTLKPGTSSRRWMQWRSRTRLTSVRPLPTAAHLHSAGTGWSGRRSS